jgi:hypothetical protein
MERRGMLCSRCGAVIPTLDLRPGERRIGSCPECGLGFATSKVTAHARSGLDETERAAQRRQMEADRLDRSRRWVAGCDFTVYGLDARWTGTRWIGGSSRSNGILASVTLAFGDPYDEARPIVRVTTHRPSPPPHFDVRTLSHSLAQHLWHEGAPHTEAMRATFQRDDDPTALWDDLVLTVGGRSTAWKTLGDAQNWVAVMLLDDAAVGIRAHAIDASSLGLARVDDFGPYMVEVPSP